jgi:hypothetical protein
LEQLTIVIIAVIAVARLAIAVRAGSFIANFPFFR